MLTFGEAARREGWYFDTATGDLLRVIGPDGDTGGAEAAVGQESPRWNPVTDDVGMPLAAVERQAQERFGRAPSGRLLNHQTARQPNGSLVTEDAAAR